MILNQLSNLFKCQRYVDLKTAFNQCLPSSIWRKETLYLLYPRHLTQSLINMVQCSYTRILLWKREECCLSLKKIRLFFAQKHILLIFNNVMPVSENILERKRLQGALESSTTYFILLGYVGQDYQKFWVVLKKWCTFFKDIFKD